MPRCDGAKGFTGSPCSDSKTKVTVIVDNLARRQKLWGEHGLSLLVEVGGRRILFDTGQSKEILIHNLTELGLDLEDVDCIVLSHGHYDHTGGLSALFTKVRHVNLYAHPEVFEKKYVKSKDDEVREVGSPVTKEELLALGATLHLDDKPTWLEDDIVLTGEIPRTTDFEDISQEFVTKRDGDWETDFLPDDRSMGIRTSKGLIIVLGCSHVGVINTIRHIQELTKTEAVYAIIGGMHLEKAGMRRIHRTIEVFATLGIERVIPLHCTGFRACAEMARLLGERFVLGSAGISFEV
jgi:7,8-dihydropterin-6-yl-methyl-4-(beta-D-ribofuranosyl)aminobenzene 5'-phosphate synthase